MPIRKPTFFAYNANIPLYMLRLHSGCWSTFTILCWGYHIDRTQDGLLVSDRPHHTSIDILMKWGTGALCPRYTQLFASTIAQGKKVRHVPQWWWLLKLRHCACVNSLIHIYYCFSRACSKLLLPMQTPKYTRHKTKTGWNSPPATPSSTPRSVRPVVGSFT